MKAAAKLAALEAGGVDNWEWYGASLYPEDEEGYDAFCDLVDERFARED